jgi:hypothetical protein
VIKTPGSADQLESSDPLTTYDQLAYDKDLKFYYKLQLTIDQVWGLVKLTIKLAIKERVKEYLSPKNYYN